jgi:hypothetical protein
MASIALTIIGCIGYLDIGAIFTCAVFLFVAAGAKKRVFVSHKKKPKVFAGRRCPWPSGQRFM